jgi:hypothetical protein
MRIPSAFIFYSSLTIHVYSIAAANARDNPFLFYSFTHDTLAAGVDRSGDQHAPGGRDLLVTVRGALRPGEPSEHIIADVAGGVRCGGYTVLARGGALVHLVHAAADWRDRPGA